MDINYYERSGRVIPPTNDEICIHPYILLSDSIMYASKTVHFVFLYMHIDTWKNELIEKLVPFFFQTKDDNRDTLAVFNELQPMIKKMSKLPNKSKQVLVAIAGYHQLLKKMRAIMKLDIEIMFEKTDILNLTPFIENKIWYMKFFDYTEASNKEDYYISELAEIIIERKNLFAFDTNVDKLFKCANLDATKDQEFDFISIPLWTMPPMCGMTYEQLLHSRENLRAPLVPFKKDLKELSAHLFPLDFSPDNLQQIQHLCTEKILPYQKPIQKNIDDSLYISQLRNKYPGDLYETIYLGITSAENLVNYYEKTKNIEPYVATQIKERISRHINLKASYVFTYFKLHIGAPIELP